MRWLRSIFLNDKLILALICINAVVIFLQGFPLSVFGAQSQQIFTLIDDIVTVCFLFEIIVKSNYFGWKEYLRSTWNKVDVLLIVLSVPPLLLRFLVDVDASHISILLVFRVFRIFKFFRLIQFFPQVEHIFRSIREALRTSFVIFVVFFMFVFIASIFSCYLYQDIAPEYFGDPIVSYYSMFKVFTIEGWNTIPDDLATKGTLSSWQVFFTQLYFVIALIFGGLIGLSIVSSVFVDAMVSDNNDDLEAQVTDIQQQMTLLQEKLDRLLEAQQNPPKDS